MSNRPCCDLSDLVPPALFRALADPNRLALLARLVACRRACSVSELRSCCGVDLSVVSRHLAKLRDAGVLEATRRGKEVLYSVRAGAVAGALRAIADALDPSRPPGGTKP